MAFKKDRGSITSSVQNNDVIGTFFFAGNDGSDYEYASFFGGIVDGTVANNNVPIALRFGTGSSSFANERMRITSSGLVGINTTTPNERLTVSGNISASGIVYTLGGNSNQWNSTFTTVNSNSANWANSRTIGLFTPLNNQPPLTGFATLDTRNSIAILDFDDTVQESAIFVGVIPEGVNLGSGLQARITWTATTAVAGAVEWGVQFMNLNTSLSADSFDTAATAATTTNSSSGVPSITTITNTNINSMAAGSFYRMRVYRNATNTINDTLTGDAELIAVEVRGVA